MQSTIIINDDTVSKEDICYFYSIAFPREQNPFFFPPNVVLMCCLGYFHPQPFSWRKLGHRLRWCHSLPSAVGHTA